LWSCSCFREHKGRRRRRRRSVRVKRESCENKGGVEWRGRPKKEVDLEVHKSEGTSV